MNIERSENFIYSHEANCYARMDWARNTVPWDNIEIHDDHKRIVVFPVARSTIEFLEAVVDKLKRELATVG